MQPVKCMLLLNRVRFKRNRSKPSKGLFSKRILYRQLPRGIICYNVLNVKIMWLQSRSELSMVVFSIVGKHGTVRAPSILATAKRQASSLSIDRDSVSIFSYLTQYTSHQRDVWLHMQSFQFVYSFTDLALHNYAWYSCKLPLDMLVNLHMACLLKSISERHVPSPKHLPLQTTYVNLIHHLEPIRTAWHTFQTGHGLC